MVATGWLAAATLFLFSVLVVGAAAQIGSTGSQACEPDHVVGVGRACVLANGLYQVFLSDGTSLVTHGLDPKTDDASAAFGPEGEQRQPVCAERYRMHVLYGYPTTDRSAEFLPQFRDHIRRTNALLHTDAMASGDVGADYRVACDENGDIRVDVFSGPNVPGASTADFTAIVNAARAAGHADADTDYVIFYDDTHSAACGIGSASDDARLSAQNAAMVGPDYGVTFVDCWFSRTPMHENGHNQGAVNTLAPDSDLNGHCIDQQDVMCYPYSDLLLGVFEFCTDRVHFDCGYDTYFDVQPEPGEWLASNWNIGSRLNKYIAFADTPAEEPLPPPATATSAAPSSSSPPTEPPTQSPAPSPTQSPSPIPASSTPTTSSAAPTTAETATTTPETTQSEEVVADAKPLAVRETAGGGGTAVTPAPTFIAAGILLLAAARWSRRQT